MYHQVVHEDCEIAVNVLGLRVFGSNQCQFTHIEQESTILILSHSIFSMTGLWDQKYVAKVSL